jgi:hypothetical protein
MNFEERKRQEERMSKKYEYTDRRGKKIYILREKNKCV